MGEQGFVEGAVGGGTQEGDTCVLLISEKGCCCQNELVCVCWGLEGVVVERKTASLCFELGLICPGHSLGLWGVGLASRFGRPLCWEASSWPGPSCPC